MTRVVSVPGLVVLVLLAVPWWILAALAGRERFVEGIVFQDQLLWYFGRTGWHWRAITQPFGHAVPITLPWCVLLPPGIWAAVREADLEKARRVRPLLVWLAPVFLSIAGSGQQREPCYLPPCPPA